MSDPVFLYDPMVMLAETSYQIVFNTALPGMGWAEVDGQRFYDEAAGLIRSDRTVHRAAVPAGLLDRAGGYTVCFQPVLDRKPYYPETGPVQRRAYAFRPVDWSDGLQLYQLAEDVYKRQGHTRIPASPADCFSAGGKAPPGSCLDKAASFLYNDSRIERAYTKG